MELPKREELEEEGLIRSLPKKVTLNINLNYCVQFIVCMNCTAFDSINNCMGRFNKKLQSKV